MARLARHRRNPEDNTMLIALAAAGAIGLLVYAMSKKNNSQLSSQAQAAASVGINAASGGALAEQQQKVTVDFGDVLMVIKLVGVGITSVATASAVGTPAAVLIAYVMKKLISFETHACQLILGIWEASGAQGLIAPKYLKKFQQYLADRVPELAFRSAVSYLGYLDKHGSALEQNVIYDVFRSPEVIFDTLTGGLGYVVRASFRQMEKDYKIPHIADAGDGSRILASKMFFDAAIVAGVPKPLAYCLLVRMAKAADAPTFISTWMKDDICKPTGVVWSPTMDFLALEQKVIAKFGAK